jgi:hypothetical protein
VTPQRLFAAAAVTHSVWRCRDQWTKPSVA